MLQGKHVVCSIRTGTTNVLAPLPTGTISYMFGGLLELSLESQAAFWELCIHGLGSIILLKTKQWFASFLL